MSGENENFHCITLKCSPVAKAPEPLFLNTKEGKKFFYT